jgi:acyl carrier protein
LFEVELERITPQANLYTDLQIDSIDAIDLIDQVRRKTGRKLDANDFRSVRTVDDVVQAMYQKQQQDADA